MFGQEVLRYFHRKGLHVDWFKVLDSINDLYFDVDIPIPSITIYFDEDDSIVRIMKAVDGISGMYRPIFRNRGLLVLIHSCDSDRYDIYDELKTECIISCEQASHDYHSGTLETDDLNAYLSELMSDYKQVLIDEMKGVIDK